MKKIKQGDGEENKRERKMTAIKMKEHVRSSGGTPVIALLIEAQVKQLIS
jgi:hypothetical protein